MSSQAVRTIIGRATTDAAFRSTLFANPAAALAGYDLTQDEIAQLRALDFEAMESFAGALDNRISKASVMGLLSALGAGAAEGLDTDAANTDGTGLDGVDADRLKRGSVDLEAVDADRLKRGSVDLEAVDADRLKRGSIDLEALDIDGVKRRDVPSDDPYSTNHGGMSADGRRTP